MALQKRITTAQLKKFESLLFTYVPALSPFEAARMRRDKSELECEKQFGAGHLEDRRTILFDTLTACKPDLEKAREVLRRTRSDYNHFVWLSRITNRKNQQWRDLQLVRKELVRWLKRARSVARVPCAVERSDWLRRASQMVLEHANHRVEDVEVILSSIIANLPSEMKIDALLSDELMQIPLPPGKHRRQRAGRASQPWIKRAHVELRAAGVTNIEDRKLLLMAIGVLPYHA
jgi:hypothetical protein